MKNLFKVWLLAMAFAFGAMQAFGQFVWTKDARNPVFTGVSGTWSANIFSPCVLFNADSARYEMWFSATPGPQSDPSWRPYSVGFAVSSDGITWSMYPSPVLSPDPGKWDSFTTDAPQVLRENGQYKMWYSSYNNNLPSKPGYFGYATSPDGIHWKKYSGNPIFGPGTSAWEAAGPYSCCVVHKQEGYKMWYDAYNLSLVTAKIGYAESSDGVNWKRDTIDNPVLNVGSSNQWDEAVVGTPTVVGIGDSMYMWYVGNQGGAGGWTGLAVSKDGITNWTKYPSNPVLGPAGASSWEAQRTCVRTVLRIGDTLHMWYDGWRTPYTSYKYRIGHATSPLSPIAAPVLLLPPNGVGSQSATLLLTWRKTPGALTYQIQVGSDGGFTTPLIDDSTVTDTSKLINNLAVNTQYYWRVKGRDADRSNTYSTSWTFVTGPDAVQQAEEFPTHYSLQQNYPNPFNPSTIIKYTVGVAGGEWQAGSDAGTGARKTMLVVYDVLGRQVATLVNEVKAPGDYEVRFDGSKLASGVYIYRLTASSYVESRKMLLLK